MSVPSVPYSSTRRKRPHWACRIFLNPRTGPGTRCDFGQNGQTNRVPSAFGVRSTITAQPGLHSLYNIGSSGTTTLAAGLTAAFATVRFTARFTGRVRRPVPRVARVRVARMFPLSPASSAIASRDLRFCFVYPGRSRSGLRPVHEKLKTYSRDPKNVYLRRCSIMRSVRLLCRVFFPNVGKAQGVCGWLPFTLPSPPPCG